LAGCLSWQRRGDALKAHGIRTSFGIDPDLLESGERAALDLIHLKGLGYDHTLN
jgi:hypothetical protein